MKKLITVTSLCLSVGMAIALANAEESTTTTESSTTTNQPTASDTSKSDTSKMDTTHSSEVSSRTSSNSRSCTDSKGKTYQQGDVGYKECRQKSKKSEQMGGQSGMTHESTESSTTTSTE